MRFVSWECGPIMLKSGLIFIVSKHQESNALSPDEINISMENMTLFNKKAGTMPKGLG
jgi:hypothetical protein